MAQYLAEIRGNRGAATRLGSKASGIYARVNGWNIGAYVDISYEDGADVVRVYRTGGSHGHGERVLIATFTTLRPELEPVDIVDSIDALVNDSILAGRGRQR